MTLKRLCVEEKGALKDCDQNLPVGDSVLDANTVLLFVRLVAYSLLNKSTHCSMHRVLVEINFRLTKFTLHRSSMFRFCYTPCIMDLITESFISTLDPLRSDITDRLD
jgi:hypothetical protein